MRATVTEVAKEHDDAWRVQLSTLVGDVFVRARCTHEGIALGSSCSAEFDVGETLRMGGNASLSTSASPSLRDQQGRIRMTGHVEAIDPEGVVYLRLATDCLVMADAAPGVFAVGTWLELDLDATKVVAHLTLAPLC